MKVSVFALVASVGFAAAAHAADVAPVTWSMMSMARLNNR